MWLMYPLWGRRRRDRMINGFPTTYAISVYHHWCWWVRISIRARCKTLCDKVCLWLATGRWFSPGPTVSSFNKTDHHDITEILLKVTLKPSKQSNIYLLCFPFAVPYLPFLSFTMKVAMPLPNLSKTIPTS